MPKPGEIVEIDGNRYEFIDKDTVKVSPKHCLWFAFANPNIQGPEGEIGEDYRPQFRAARGAYVVISVTNQGAKWSHHSIAEQPTWASGPDGRLGTSVTLENGAYQSGTYYSTYIHLAPDGNGGIESYPLNSLVCMFTESTPPTQEAPADIELVGAGPKGLDRPGDATQIFLGFHDGREWTNNEGDVMNVELDWYNIVGQ